MDNIFIEYTKIVPAGFFYTMFSFMIISSIFSAIASNWHSKKY